jgi:adenylate kinase family enzyme
MYGRGEGLFNHLFRAAWLNPDNPLNCLGDGQNTLPTVHVADAASLVARIDAAAPSQSHFVLNDGSQVRLAELVRAVSTATGTGKVKHITKAEGALIPDITQSKLDSLLSNIKFGACPWTLKKFTGMQLIDGGPALGCKTLTKEFLAEHRLNPVRIMITGPPAVGKTSVANNLAYYYRVEHITETAIVSAGLASLRVSAGKLEGLPEEETIAEEQKEAWLEEKAKMEAAREALERFTTEPAVLKKEKMGEWLKIKLDEVKCRVHGYVLDGFPKTATQCKLLFGELPLSSAQRDELPAFIAQLDASDDFLRERVLNLPEKEFMQKYSIEDGALDPALTEYHALAVDADPKKKVDPTKPIDSANKMVMDYFRTACVFCVTIFASREMVSDSCTLLPGLKPTCTQANATSLYGCGRGWGVNVHRPLTAVILVVYMLLLHNAPLACRPPPMLNRITQHRYTVVDPAVIAAAGGKAVPLVVPETSGPDIAGRVDNIDAMREVQAGARFNYLVYVSHL